MEMDKSMEIEFSNLCLQYFHNISSLWKRSHFFSVTNKQYIYIYTYLLLTECAVRTVGYGRGF